MKKLMIIAALFLAMSYSKTMDPRPTRKLKHFDIEYNALQQINKVTDSTERKRRLIDFLYNGYPLMDLF